MAAPGFPSVMSFDLLHLLKKGGSLPSVISFTLSELVPPSSCKGQKELLLTHVCICLAPVTSGHFSQDARGESYHMSVLGFPSVICFVLFAMCLNYVCTCSSLCPFVLNMGLPTYHLFWLAFSSMCRASLIDRLIDCLPVGSTPCMCKARRCPLQCYSVSRILRFFLTRACSFPDSCFSFCPDSCFSFSRLVLRSRLLPLLTCRNKNSF